MTESTRRTARSRLVVVGGGIAAIRACEEARRQGFPGELVVLAAETHDPYDRPPLSKAVLAGTQDPPTLRFDPVALDVDLRLGTRAVALDTDRHVVTTEDGEFGYDLLVAATGSDAVLVPGGPQVTLRTIDDARFLRDRLTPGAHVVVVGAGWIGAEVATAALGRGARVTCVEASAAPCSPSIGAEVAGELFTGWWSTVDLRLGTGVTRVEDGRVHLSDGDTLQADVVVVGVGARPNVGWLADSGVEVDRGVLVDEHLRSSAPGVAAVGDVAARWSRRWRCRMRVEHWDDAGSAPAVAVRALMHAGADEDLPVHDPVPYFWSDQFGHRMQYAGRHTDRDRLEWRDHGDGGARTARWFGAEGRLTAVLSVDRPREISRARREIAAVWDSARI